jgi:hypothetical protein
MKSPTANLEDLALTRLSANFILRDFLYSTSSAARGIPNTPDDAAMVIRSGRALCARVLEPLVAQFGTFAITFGYQCRQGIEAAMTASQRRLGPHSSNPHQWDRGTFGSEVYARVDIWPFAVEDGKVSKRDYGHWAMHNLDIDLLMQWTRSNVFCITISPKPRRVWIEWGDISRGEPKQRVFMGADYWQRLYPALPQSERPKYGPSHTGGALRWRTA